MDLADPSRAITPTLDGPVLTVLARAGRPLTVGQIAEQSARGSEIGIRRSVARLVAQGTVVATQMGRNQVHELNRDHLAAPAAAVLSNLRVELWRRFRADLAGWEPAPVYACAFGSAARGDGDVDSDIDLLLVHPLFARDDPETTRSPGAVQLLADIAVAFAHARHLDPEHERAWLEQIDALRQRAHRWTGNQLQVLDLSPYQWWRRSDADHDLFEAIARDSIDLAGTAPPSSEARRN